MNDFHQILGENPIILFLPGLVAYMMHEISYFDIKVTNASMEQDYKMEHRFRIFWSLKIKHI